MAQDHHPSFAPSWFSTFEDHGSLGREQRRHAFERLWRAFMRARAFIAAVLLALQVFELLNHSGGPNWLVLVSALHLTAALAVMFWWPVANPGKAGGLQWPLTIGVDLLVFALLQFFQQGGLNYTPLFALPVLLAAVLGSMTLALATAASVTLFLLGEAAASAALLSEVSASRFLQAGLTGTGFFIIALLA
ncbi:MAG: PAS domain-containing sensor histidine kinase, partial [Gammaproteobacteria bacterium]|nr:PAS domain-containing sensor histidine kinase [Gammaproteobacteria bacterium]